MENWVANVNSTSKWSYDTNVDENNWFFNPFSSNIVSKEKNAQILGSIVQSLQVKQTWDVEHKSTSLTHNSLHFAPSPHLLVAGTTSPEHHISFPGTHRSPQYKEAIESGTGDRTNERCGLARTSEAEDERVKSGVRVRWGWDSVSVLAVKESWTGDDALVRARVGGSGSSGLRRQLSIGKCLALVHYWFDWWRKTPIHLTFHPALAAVIQMQPFWYACLWIFGFVLKQWNWVQVGSLPTVVVSRKKNI